MKRRSEETRKIVDRYLEDLGQPVPQDELAKGTRQVLNRLRRGDAPMVGSVESPPSPKHLWGRAAIAAGIAALLTGGVLQVAPFRQAIGDVVARSVEGELVIDGVERNLLSSADIQTGRMVRAGDNGGTVALLDGSEIEMGPDTEMTVVRAKDGLRVLLVSGNLIVTAAKQGSGHLYVETRDCVVSVVGTVFTVKAEETGSRVSVIEGEVHVQRGNISQTLLPGQQIATSPELGPVPLETEVKWSRAAVGLATLAQQSVPGAPSPAIGATQALRGLVTNGSGKGIPDVTVTLCTTPGAEADSGRRTRFLWTTPAQNDGLDREQKRHVFYGLWDATVCPGPRNEVTNSEGRFEFSDVASGNYVVTAERQGFLPPEDSATAADANARRQGVLQYFFQGEGRTVGTTAGQAVSANVTVGDGQSPEVSLRLVEGAVIAGTVRDSAGRTVANTSITVVPVSQGNASEQRAVVQTTTNDRGEFRAYWLYPGEYKVVARGSGALTYSLGYTYRGASPNGAAEGYGLSLARAPETWYTRGATEEEATPISVREGEEVSAINIVLRDVPPESPGQSPFTR